MISLQVRKTLAKTIIDAGNVAYILHKPTEGVDCIPWWQHSARILPAGTANYAFKMCSESLESKSRCIPGVAGRAARTRSVDIRCILIAWSAIYCNGSPELILASETQRPAFEMSIPSSGSVILSIASCTVWSFCHSFIRSRTYLRCHASDSLFSSMLYGWNQGGQLLNAYSGLTAPPTRSLSSIVFVAIDLVHVGPYCESMAHFTCNLPVLKSRQFTAETWGAA